MEELYYTHVYANTINTLNRRFAAAVAAWPELSQLEPLVAAMREFALQINTKAAQLKEIK